MKRLLLPIFYLLILLPSTALGSSIHIPQTGQTTVYASADDGDTKTGTAWPSPRFTDNGNGTVADTMTGLTWAKDANIIKNRDPGFDADGTGGDGIVSWQHALDYVKKLNAESYLGYNDWRLPNLNELASLLNEGQSSGSAWLTAQSFLNPQSTFYWSSTTTSSSLGQAWAVSIDGGMVGHLDKSLFGSVWPVRGGNNASFLPQTGQVDCYDVQGAAIPCAGTGQDGELQRGLSWPDPRFTENGDGTVTDNLTGLVWSLDAKPLVGAANVDDPAVSWQGALDQVQTMNKEAYLGFTDWRLPNRNELASLINYSDSTLTWLTRQGILNPQNDYWSSSTFTPSPDRAWNIGMNGEIFSKVKAGNDNSYRGSFVWPVRGGRTFALTISKTGSASGTVEADIGAIVWSQSSGTLFCPPGTRISLSAAPDAGAIFAGWGGPCNGVQACTISMDADQSVTATFSLGGLTTGVNTKALVAMQPAASGLSITTTSLTAGTADAAYSKSLAASGGKTPYTWSITSGTLPAGLSLSSAGVISGTPTTAGSSSFTVQVKDASNTTATKSLSLTINPAPLAVSTVSLPSAAVGVSYNQSLAASGGTPPYTWSRTTGTLPSGITLSTSGVLSGAPTTSGTSTFTVQVKDSKSTTATKSLSLTVAVPLQINNSVLSNGYVGAVYSDTVSASGGKTPYSWALAGGSLPSGLAIDAGTGTVSGTPTTAGTYNSTVQVKDANNTVVTNPLTIVILPAVSVSTSSLPADYVGVSYSQTLMAAGGVAPYTWSIVAGSLPAGLALASDTGLISGTPTAAGTTSFSVQVKDAINAVATKTISMTVSGLGSIAGVVTDAATGAPLAGVTVTLSLTGITSPNSTDLQYSCNSTPLAAGDYSTVSLNDGSKFGCTSSGKYNTMTFKAKNPFGMDPFTVSWNGISALNRVDYVAQSFKPTADGSLNKVSFYLPYGKDQGRTGQVWVQLKSALGGDAGSQIAESNSVGIDFLPTGTPTWVDFVFPTPAMLTAGQQYYLEIQGNVWNGPALDALYWGNYASYANGSSYQRAGGVWSQLSNSLSFQTFVNSQPDLVVTGPTSSYALTMAGGAVQEANLYVYDQINGWNLPGGTVDSSIGHLIYTSDGFEYNGDDLTINWTVGDKLANYYDPNGWVILTVNNYSRLWSSPPVTTLVTDRFKVSFNRTLTAVTDANGAYSFASLPGGDYNLAFDKSPYTAQSMTGALAPGQGLNVPASLAMPAPASLQGTVTSNGVAIAGVRVTVTDASGTKRAVTGNDGSYLVGGIVSGDYTASFEAPGFNGSTQTGSLASGQLGVVNVVLSALPIVVTISSPGDGASISVLPLTVSGSAQYADSVTLTVSNNGVATDYPATVSNGAFSASLPLAVGQTAITVTASSRYGQSAGSTITVSTAPFTVRNLGDVGNVAVMEVTGNFDGKNPDGTNNTEPRALLAAEYFKNHGDLDFLVFLTSFDYAMPEKDVVGFYTGVRNDTLGLNEPLSDRSALFGSAGMLQGTIDLGNVTPLVVSPYGSNLGQFVGVLNHEIGHRFLSYVRFMAQDGALSTDLIGRENAHWSYLLDTQGSVMLGNGWRNNGDGTFTSVQSMNTYSPLDLYLMGMIPKEQVPPMLLIQNPAIDKTQLPQLGATISGTAKTVTIDDIIAAEGARIPDVANSQKKFSVGFVLLKRPGEDLSTAPAAIETLRTAWAGRFTQLTRGVGGINGVPASLTVAVDTPGEGATITGPDVTVTGAVINTAGAETGVTVNGIPATVSGNSFVATHVPLQQGANSLIISATDANGLTATTTRSVSASAGHYLRIVPNVLSGTAPLNISLQLRGSFTITNPVLTGTGPVQLSPSVDSPTEYVGTFPFEGTYTVTASATGPDGHPYSDTVSIIVLSNSQLQDLLQAKWQSVTSKIASGDIDGAVAFFVKPAQDTFRETFTALGGNLPALANELKPLSLVYVSDDRAKCKMLRNETMQGKEVTVEYVVYFREEDGIWKLQDF